MRDLKNLGQAIAASLRETFGTEPVGQEERLETGNADHPVRQKILNHLLKRPRTNLRQLCQDLELNRGTATHHLRVLERDGLIKSERQGRERRFVAEGAHEVRELIEQLGELGLEVAARIAASPGATRRMLAAWCNVDEDTLQVPLETLVANGLVEERRSAGDHAYHPLSAMGRLVLVPGARPKRSRPA